MPNFTAVHFSEANEVLDAITNKVREAEGHLGPLLAISSCESFPGKLLTCFTHENANAPGQAIELHLCPGGVIPTIPGKTLVCKGRCFVKGELRTVAAFR